MSNLSDLLPAGAGAKSATFTASGTLTTGTTVVLNTDGTVSAVAQISQSASAGTATQITSNRSGPQSAVYDASSGKVVFVYIDELNSNYATAAVGTISGTSISFGTPVVVSSNSADDVHTSVSFYMDALSACLLDPPHGLFAAFKVHIRTTPLASSLAKAHAEALPTPRPSRE